MVADVYRLCSYTNLLDSYKRQRIELDNNTTCVENKLLATHSRLTHATICTRLIPHLSHHRPTTPPSYHTTVLPHHHQLEFPASSLPRARLT